MGWCKLREPCTHSSPRMHFTMAVRRLARQYPTEDEIYWLIGLILLNDTKETWVEFFSITIYVIRRILYMKIPCRTHLACPKWALKLIEPSRLFRFLKEHHHLWGVFKILYYFSNSNKFLIILDAYLRSKVNSDYNNDNNNNKINNS